MADPLERIAHLLVLPRQLRRVVEVLPATAAAGAEVRTGRRHAVGPLGQAGDRDRLAVAPLDLRHPRPDAIAGQRAVDEQHEVVEAGDPSTTEGECVDHDFDLAALLGT